MQKESREIKRELIEEFGIPEYIMNEVETSMFRFLKKAMKEKKGVMFPYIGKFVLKTSGKTERDPRSLEEQGEGEAQGEGRKEDESLRSMST